MPEGTLIGDVVDQTSGRSIPARVYVLGPDGTRHYPTPSVAHPAKRDLEGHVATLGKPFQVSLPAGKYTVRIERGPEFIPTEEQVDVPGEGAVERKFTLRRWIDMAAAGWYSGDLHVHRPLADISALMHAEDVNVTMPLTVWEGRSRDPDLDMFAQHSESGVVVLDDRHLFTIYNQEYEPARSPTGAVLIMGMRELTGKFDPPPLEPVFDAAHRLGGFVDMEKHSWAWAPVIAATGKCDVFELANNHHWREKCLYIDFEVPMRSLKEQYPLTIEGWTMYGFDSWYAYLNCGFNMAPVAGTANGVHPNPLGHNRVYVHLDEPLSAVAWQRAMLAGRSFITNGPMLFFQVDGHEPGSEIEADGPTRVTGRIELRSVTKPQRLELVRGGDVIRTFPITAAAGSDGLFRVVHDFEAEVNATTYFAARAFVEPPSRDTIRFAHSGIVRVKVPNRPLRPRKFEVEHFAARVQSMIEEIESGKLRAGDREQALEEYKRALATYERIAEQAV